MKEFELRYDKVLFLSAYLRQINLSLDRSRWTPFNDLKDYYKTVIKPEQVINYLKKEFSLKEEDLQTFVTPAFKRTFISKIKVVFSQKLKLSKNEILLLCKLLIVLQDKIDSDTEEYNLELEKLRIDVVKFYSSVFNPVLLRKDCNKVTRVEHYLQSYNINTTGMDEFITEDFCSINKIFHQ